MTRPPDAGAEIRPERNYAPAIYGSLLVTGIVAVQWRTDASTDTIAITVLVSVLVFWLAHVWSEIVNRRVHGQITLAEARGIAATESSMLWSLIVPAIALAIGPRLGMSVDNTIELALVICIGQLFLWGVIVGRAAHRGWVLPLVVALVDSLLGIVLVALKVAVLH
jgi:hypothetical protein